MTIFNVLFHSFASHHCLVWSKLPIQGLDQHLGVRNSAVLKEFLGLLILFFLAFQTGPD